MEAILTSEQDEENKKLKEMLIDLNHLILQMQDKQLGLEAQLATLKAGTNREPLLIELMQLRASFSYRLGLFLTYPFRTIAKFVNFFEKFLKWLIRNISSRVRKKVDRSI